MENDTLCEEVLNSRVLLLLNNREYQNTPTDPSRRRPEGPEVVDQRESTTQPFSDPVDLEREVHQK